MRAFFLDGNGDTRTAHIKAILAFSPPVSNYPASFHSPLRDDFLAREEFESLIAVHRMTSVWNDDYNHHRPHGSLGYSTPSEFAARYAASAPGSSTASAAPPTIPPLQQHSGLTPPIPS